MEMNKMKTNKMEEKTSLRNKTGTRKKKSLRKKTMLNCLSSQMK